MDGLVFLDINFVISLKLDITQVKTCNIALGKETANTLLLYKDIMFLIQRVCSRFCMFSFDPCITLPV